MEGMEQRQMMDVGLVAGLDNTGAGEGNAGADTIYDYNEVRDEAGSDQAVALDRANAAEAPGEMVSRSTNLGPIDFVSIEDADLTAGPLHYQLETTHTGLLSVEVGSSTAFESVGLRLYSQDLTLLAESSPADGSQRIDWHTSPGVTYYVEVYGTIADVDIRIANLINQVGTAVTVYGTDGNDEYEFDAETGWRIVINGIEYKADLAEIETITFDTGAGVDTVRLNDSPGDDTIEAGYRWVTAKGPGYALEGSNFEYLLAYARAEGLDKVILHDSPMDNKFKSKPAKDFATMYCGQLYNRAKFFEVIEANFSNGGTDTANVWDTPFDDRYEGMPGDCRFYSTETTHDVTIRGADLMTVYSTGGQDALVLHDTPNNDVFLARSHKVQLFNRDAEGPIYNLTARNFNDVTVIADKGGDADIAKLHDSTVDTLWEAAWRDDQTWSKMSSSANQFYEVLAFEQVKGYSHAPGQSAIKRDASVDFLMQWGDWEEWTDETGSRSKAATLSL
jgi:hypothetical protein